MSQTPQQGSISQEMINSGIRILNDAPCQDQATITITGMGRSGTTMVAKVLDAMGLPFGEQLNPFREDHLINSAVKKKDEERFTELCRERDRQHPKWALKSPKMRGHLNRFAAHMTNPRFIITFRDILAISIRNEIVIQTELNATLMTVLRGYRKILEEIETLQAPTLLLSYEKALQFPHETVHALSQFCGVTLTQSQVADLAALIVNGDSDYIEASKITQAAALEKKQREAYSSGL